MEANGPKQCQMRVRMQSVKRSHCYRFHLRRQYLATAVAATQNAILGARESRLGLRTTVQDCDHIFARRVTQPTTFCAHQYVLC